MNEQRPARADKSLSVRLTEDELAAFTALCERQGVKPATLLRDMVNLYVGCDGNFPSVSTPEDLDRFLGSFLDWYLDHASTGS